MIIELCANRILAPWFGNSLYTWTGLIGIILVAMSVGYYFGGWLVDRRPNFVTLVHLLMMSAFFTLVIPLFHTVLEDSFSETNLVWGPILASLVLFALPGCLLGSVSPFAIRLISLLYADKRIGLSAGWIGMASTLGSVVGTFSAGFLLIPHMGIRAIFLFTGIILGLLAAIGYTFFPSGGRKKALLINASILVPLIFGVFASGSKVPAHVVFNQTTFYHQIRVFQSMLPNGDYERTLYLDTTIEGAQYEKSRELPIAYQRYWELVKIFCPKIKSAAFMGAGAYAMPQSLLDAYPHVAIDVIEIDPKLVEVGRSFFRLKEYPQIAALVDDARHYLNTSKKRYDLIFGDAYNGVRYVPAHLITLEFFELIKKRLDEKGVYMMNLISAIQGENSNLFLSVVKTLGLVFDHTYVFALHPNRLTEAQNIIIVASGQKLSMHYDFAKMDPNARGIKLMLGTYVPPNMYDISKATVLSDNFNPVEYMVAKSLIKEINGR
jgi:spermidine synthase